MQKKIKRTAKFIKKSSKTAGLSPGTLMHVGEQKIDKARITLTRYDQERLEEKEFQRIEEAFSHKETPPVTWINIDGLHEIAVIEKIGTHFGIHPLTMEDIVNTGQRPKVEDFESYIYLVFKMLKFDEKTGHLSAEQVSLILGPHYLISFQETEGDVFNSVRERIRKGRVHIRKSGPDYLAYALIDAVVDHYFLILEKIAEKIEHFEEQLHVQPTPEILQAIYDLKRELIYFRKQVWPIREVLSTWQKTESAIVQEANKVFIRDVYDHTIQVIDTIESFRDILSGLMDLYLSTVSNKMNEVMKVLTIMATIFIPLTFVAGIYGMNFKFMPELEWKWSYPVLWILLIVIFCGMMFYFKRKRWL
ncbi:MAG: magnesium/cobalt transporter CorA [Desulfobacterales bacterium]|jgi:magnesium transporter|nr:magnesium/cobalt transporter CorA [Desulfobacterales bacterium]MDH3827156.1 magnesium/cobalt transporter CorA [Desulfobacterales bacterium]MDH3876418.1 magnesium/cobalt transporter CorA [Desulfobacterales bacterium]